MRTHTAKNPLVRPAVRLALSAVMAAVTLLPCARPLCAQDAAGTPTQDKVKQSAELQEFLDRVRGFGRRGLFGRGGSARHVEDADGNITQLRLGNVELKPGDARIIAGLEHLEKLDLRESSVSDEDVRQLESLRSLNDLSLSRTKISGIAVASVGRMAELKNLDLSGTKISDRDLRHLRGLLNLDYLQLARTSVSDAGLQTLSEMPQLGRISLGRTKITDAGMKHLARLPRLRGVTLNDTRVTETGLQQIAKMAGFEWMADPGRCANEYVLRIELARFDAAREMFSAGVTIPERGSYRLISLEPIDPSTKDRQRARHPFKVRLHWVDKEKKTDEILTMKIAIDRGAVLIMELGIEDEQ